MNARISPVDPAHAQGKAKDLLAAVQAKLGMTPNMMRTMAQSPAVLEGYLSLNGALAHGALSGSVREQIALAVSQTNECEYCVSAHHVLGKMAGLKPEQILAARHGRATDAKARAALTLANEIVARRGDVFD